MRNRAIALILAVILTIFTAACSGGAGGKKLPALKEGEELKIKVMFWDDQYFFQEYGNLFNTKFPNVDIEVVNMQSLYMNDSANSTEDEFQKLINEHKPDVMLLAPDQYEDFAASGKLYALDPVIKQDKYDLTGIHPAILKLLRDKGNGSLYGLSPTFSGTALFYNRDLFAQYGVELPKDSMSWEEVMTLAGRFPADGADDKRVYGYALDSYMTLDQLVWQIAMTSGLQLLNGDGTRMNIETESWKKAYETALNAAANKYLYVPAEKDRNMEGGSIQDFYKKDLFLTGRAAMFTGNVFEVNKLVQSKDYLKDTKPLNWQLVTAPVDPKNRTQSPFFTVDNIYAVSSDSQNVRAAWELVKYINSEECAKLKSKSTAMSGLLSRTAYNTDQDGKSMEPFYKLDPNDTLGSVYRKASALFIRSFQPILKEETQAVYEGKKTIKEGLHSIQQRGQQALDDARKKQQEAGATASASAKQ